MKLTPYVADCPAAEVNRSLKQAVRAMDQARHCAVLWFQEVVRRELFRELGYSSIYQYAAVELEFSKTRTGNYLQLVRKLDGLPHLRRSMKCGQVGYTKALEVIKVADPRNEARWVEQARTTPRNELRKSVDQARKTARRAARSDPAQGELLAPPVAPTPTAAVTHRVGFEMTAEQFARYEALVGKVHQRRGAAAGTDRVEVLLQAMAALVERPDAVAAGGAPAARIHVHQCPDCEKATVATSRGELELGAPEIERLACDAQVARPGQKNRSPIPPGTRRRVLARDRHRCQGPGCTNTRFLEVHHIVPRSRGGTHREENLVTLCGACHRRVHEKSLPVGGFRLRKPPGNEKLEA